MVVHCIFLSLCIFKNKDGVYITCTVSATYEIMQLEHRLFSKTLDVWGFSPA